MKSNSATSLCIALLAAFIILRLSSFILAQGSLTPPPGPPAPTMKTLTEVQPRTAIGTLTTPGDGTSVVVISQPGSYYLTGNITGVSGKNGIKIAAGTSGTVHIDFNGFTLAGVGGSLNGILGNGAALRVGHGTISGWGGHGINADGGDATWVGDITCLANAGDGVHASTSDSVVDLSDLALLLNGGDGVELGGGGTLRNIKIKHNDAAGVRILASAMGVELDHVSISGSGVLISDAGWGTHIGFQGDTTHDDFTGSSAVVLGPNATVHGMTLNVMGGTFTGPVVDASAADISINGLTIKATGATAASLLTLGDNGDVSSKDAAVLTADNCTLSTAMLNVIGDNVTLGGITVTASGSTTAPAAMRIAGSRCDLADYIGDFLTAGVPNGCDVVGSSNTIGGMIIKGVPTGGTGIRIQAGANGNQIDGCRISGGAGAITAISVAGNNTLAIHNRINALNGGTAISNTGANNVVAPTTTGANIATLTNPLSNIVH